MTTTIRRGRQGAQVKIACGFLLLLLVGTCTGAEDATAVPENHRPNEEIVTSDGETVQPGNELPVLPPLILFDFGGSDGNDTDASNSTAESTETKSKRTIESSLGYPGFNGGNNFETAGKLKNYYFPAVRTPIHEEHFERQVIPTEPPKPNAENQPEEGPRKAPLLPTPLPLLPLMKSKDQLPLYPPYPTFGEHSKIRKSRPRFRTRPNFKPLPKPTEPFKPSSFLGASETPEKFPEDEFKPIVGPTQQVFEEPSQFTEDSNNKFTWQRPEQPIEFLNDQPPIQLKNAPEPSVQGPNRFRPTSFLKPPFKNHQFYSAPPEFDSAPVFSSPPQRDFSNYKPQMQQYLNKLFASSSKLGGQHHNYLQSPPVDTLSDLQPDYSSLLDYNPSISQYVRNPNAILKAKPTYIQAGSNYIPVIILRVDGPAPLPPPSPEPLAPSSNLGLNLKALLQQYLTQYALASGYRQQDPLQDLRSFTEALAALRQFAQQPTYSAPIDSSFQSPAYTPSQWLTSAQTPSNHQQDLNNYSNHRNNHRDEYPSKAQVGKVKLPSQKVKNVQIIEDPRYASYKIEK